MISSFSAVLQPSKQSRVMNHKVHSRRRLRRITATPCLVSTPTRPNLGPKSGQASELCSPPAVVEPLGGTFGRGKGRRRSRRRT
eukprot:2110829-Pyramimonas_sp.AAC.1